MAELDIDKILEAREKKEKGNKQKKESMKLAAYVIIGCVAAAVVILVVMLMLGEKSDDYLPFDGAYKVSLNLTGGSPETWQFINKPEAFDEYECYALNMTDMSDNTSKQEYYANTGEGIYRVAVSENFSTKKKYIMMMLPAKISVNKKFTVVNTVSGEITGIITEKEKQRLMTGDADVIKVDYKGAGFMDKTVWYAKGIGIIKSEDRLSGRVYNLINIEQAAN